MNSVVKKNIIMYQKLQNYLKGKRVCIVGPAPTIMDLKNGKEIDSYDVVIRINKPYKMTSEIPEYCGKKTDVLINCLNTHEENGGPYLDEWLNLDWVFCPYPLKPPFEKDIVKFIKEEKYYNLSKEKFCFNKLDEYNTLEKKVRCRPNSGMAGIDFILKSKFKELFITGFTFFKGGYVKSYREYGEEEVLNRMISAGNHIQDYQFKYFKILIKKYKNVKVDSGLMEILKNEKL